MSGRPDKIPERGADPRQRDRGSDQNTRRGPSQEELDQLRDEIAAQSDRDPEDIAVEQSEDGIEARLTESAQREDVITQAASQLDDFGVDDLTAERGEDGFNVEVRDEALRERARSQAASQLDGFSEDDIAVEQTDDGIKASVKDDSLRERVTQQAQESFEFVDPSASQIDVSISEDGASAEIDDAVQREEALRAADAQLDAFDRDEINISETDSGFEASVPESIQRERVREQAAEQLDDFGVDDISVEETEEGGFRADVPDEAQREAVREQAANELDDFGVEDISVEASDDGFTAEVTDEARREQVREELFAGLPDDLEGVERFADPSTGEVTRVGLERAENAQESGDIGVNTLQRAFDAFENDRQVLDDDELVDVPTRDPNAVNINFEPVFEEETVEEGGETRQRREQTGEEANVSLDDEFVQERENLLSESLREEAADELDAFGLDDIEVEETDSGGLEAGVRPTSERDYLLDEVGPTLFVTQAGDEATQTAIELRDEFETLSGRGSINAALENSGSDLNSTAPVGDILSELDPEAAAERELGLTADEIEAAQAEISDAREQAQQNPDQFLAELDDFDVEDALRFDNATQRGSQRRSELRNQADDIESEIAADTGVDADDVELRPADGELVATDDTQETIARTQAAEQFNVDPSQIELDRAGDEFEASLTDEALAELEPEPLEPLTGSGRIDGIFSDPVDAGAGSEPLTGSRRIGGLFSDPVERPEVTEQINQQREDFREIAADELDVDAEDVEVTREDGTLTAETSLTSGQSFFDELAGGRLSGVVDTGQSLQDTAADAFTNAGESYGQVAFVPAALAGGAVARGVDATGVEAPDFDGLASDVGAFGTEAVEAGSELVGDVGRLTASGAPTQPLYGPDGAVGVGETDPSLDNAWGAVDAGVGAFEDTVDAFGDVLPDPTPREAGETVREAAATPLDTLGDFTAPGAPTQPLYGPDGAVGVEAPGAEAPALNQSSEFDAPDIDSEDALALGAAGVVTPEPSTSIGGAALAIGAAGVLGADAIRRGEIDTPDPEDLLGGGSGAAEIEAPDEPEGTAEIETPADSTIDNAELDVGSGVVEAEIDVPDDTGTAAEVGLPDIEAAGVGQAGVLEELEDEEQPEDEDVVEPVEIDDPEDFTGEIARQQYEQSQFEVEERYGEEIRDTVPEAPTEEVPGEINDIDDGIAGVGEPEPFRDVDSFAENFEQAIEETQVQEDFERAREPVVTPGDAATVEAVDPGTTAADAIREVTGRVEAVQQTQLDAVGSLDDEDIGTGVTAEIDSGLAADIGTRGQLDDAVRADSRAETVRTNTQATTPGFSEPTGTFSSEVGANTIPRQQFEPVETDLVTQNFSDPPSNPRPRRPRLGFPDLEGDEFDDIGLDLDIDEDRIVRELELPDFLGGER